MAITKTAMYNCCVVERVAQIAIFAQRRIIVQRVEAYHNGLTLIIRRRFVYAANCLCSFWNVQTCVGGDHIGKTKTKETPHHDTTQMRTPMRTLQIEHVVCVVFLCFVRCCCPLCPASLLRM